MSTQSQSNIRLPQIFFQMIGSLSGLYAIFGSSDCSVYVDFPTIPFTDDSIGSIPHTVSSCSAIGSHHYVGGIAPHSMGPKSEFA